MALRDIKVPDLGDFRDVEIIEVHVKPGDTVKAEAPLITLETDKAAMEVPAPVGGVIKEVLVQTGGKVSEGSLIVRLEADASSAPGATQDPPQERLQPRPRRPRRLRKRSRLKPLLRPLPGPLLPEHPPRHYPASPIPAR